MILRINRLLLSLILINYAWACIKTPPFESYSRKRSGDNGYRIIIGDGHEKYEPGKIYNLFLLGSRTHTHLQQFTHFMLTAQAASGPSRTASLSTAGPKRVGRFQLFSDGLTQFDDDCVNTVSEVDDFPKSEIQVMWVAPAAGSGCVSLSAMVYENDNSWYADDGALTKIICEKVSDKEFVQGECCACDDAKYNFIFEGIWSNETHPKDYPFAVWLTHFSDIIGATHETNFSFWGENHIATDGFRSLAEWGSVRSLRIELEHKQSKLRSLFQAAGLWYPDVNKNTSSEFKVDRKHPKVSLVSMFGPSPDWVVGVSGLDLCKEDCSWVESLDVDLYPWDAGTDNGITYMSPNSETQPRERMYRITTLYPEDPRAPFYNINSREMIPLAKLYIRKERNIPRKCDDIVLQQQLEVSENNEDTVRPECETTEYSTWSPCSRTCGKGLRMRTRQYRMPERAKRYNCKRQLVAKEMCVADVAECEGDSEPTGEPISSGGDTLLGEGVCATSDWSEWSECTASCGAGITMRTRTFIDHMGRKKCPHISVVEKEKCMMPECLLSDIEIPDPMCPVTTWSDWSPCSATCGPGIRIRTRLYLGEPALNQTCSSRIQMTQHRNCTERPACTFDSETAREICILKPDVGPCRGSFQRYAYYPEQRTCNQFIYGGCRGNRNNFINFEDCINTCQGITTVIGNFNNEVTTRPIPRRQGSSSAPAFSRFSGNSNGSLDNELIDCELSDWTQWTPCNVTCGTGFSEKYRNVIRESQNGGAACPKRVVKRKRCIRPACV